MRLARESGCYGVFIGFETFSKKSIRDAGKGVNRPDEYLRDIRRIHEAGIKVWGSFIFGFDNDGLEVFRETLDFIEQSGMEFAQFSLLTPLPGTALFEQFDEQQRIVHRDWSKYDLGSIVFNHPLLSAERLHFEKNHAWRRFYSIRSIIKRLGMPKTRGDIILWIANLAVMGALKYRWHNDYWTWNDTDAPTALQTPPRRFAGSFLAGLRWCTVLGELALHLRSKASQSLLKQLCRVAVHANRQRLDRRRSASVFRYFLPRPITLPHG